MVGCVDLIDFAGDKTCMLPQPKERCSYNVLEGDADVSYLSGKLELFQLFIQ